MMPISDLGETDHPGGTHFFVSVCEGSLLVVACGFFGLPPRKSIPKRLHDAVHCLPVPIAFINWFSFCCIFFSESTGLRGKKKNTPATHFCFLWLGPGSGLGGERCCFLSAFCFFGFLPSFFGSATSCSFFRFSSSLWLAS